MANWFKYHLRQWDLAVIPRLFLEISLQYNATCIGLTLMDLWACNLLPSKRKFTHWCPYYTFTIRKKARLDKITSMLHFTKKDPHHFLIAFGKFVTWYVLPMITWERSSSLAGSLALKTPWESGSSSAHAETGFSALVSPTYLETNIILCVTRSWWFSLPLKLLRERPTTWATTSWVWGRRDNCWIFVVYVLDFGTVILAIKDKAVFSNAFIKMSRYWLMLVPGEAIIEYIKDKCQVCWCCLWCPKLCKIHYLVYKRTKCITQIMTTGGAMSEGER